MFSSGWLASRWSTSFPVNSYNNVIKKKKKNLWISIFTIALFQPEQFLSLKDCITICQRRKPVNHCKFIGRSNLEKSLKSGTGFFSFPTNSAISTFLCNNLSAACFVLLSVNNSFLWDDSSSFSFCSASSSFLLISSLLISW